MEIWYDNYWAQNWYRTTFLVRWPRQIGRTTAAEPEWNNIEDCGCNFTCLAMMAGIDPARLASELSRVPRFFTADRDHPTRYLDGTEDGLVWDQNRPHPGRPLAIPNVWHPARKGRAAITIEKLGDIQYPRTLDAAHALVAAARGRGHHVICGPDTHSMLVAGMDDAGDYVIWDPNADATPVEDSLGGKLTLPLLFGGERRIEFAVYDVRFADAV